MTMSKVNNTDVERRTQDIVLEVQKDSRKVIGYASVFDERSSLICGCFYEYIDRGAFDGVIENSDVLALVNHDISRGVLARSRNGAGSLSLTVDERGLRYEFDAPETQLGDELLEGIKRGDITASSFGFTVADEEWSYPEGEPSVRHIKKVRALYDVSPVYHPAYRGTSVAARSLEMAKGTDKEATETKQNNDIKYKFL